MSTMLDRDREDVQTLELQRNISAICEQEWQKKMCISYCNNFEWNYKWVIPLWFYKIFVSVNIEI